jgi:hypothetical protein
MSTAIEDVVIPTAWNGLSRAQLVAYAQLMFPYRRKLISVKDDQLFVEDEELFKSICFGLLYYFLELDWETYQKIPAEEIHRLLYQERVLHFLWETYDLDVNLIDFLETEKGTLVGPSDFGQLSFEEMQIADGHFIGYVNTAEADELNRFISCLYRPADATKKYGDKRKPFDADLIEYQLAEVAALPDEEKVAALIWYESQRDVLIENYSKCFTTGEAPEQKQTLMQMMLSIGQGIEKFDIVRKSSALLVYADIERVIEQNRKLKENGNNHI